MSLSGFIHVAGWEDGEKVEKDLDGLDRWTTQNADTLRINISNDLQVHVKQDPHSKHLGGYVSFMFYTIFIFIVCFPFLYCYSIILKILNSFTSLNMGH